MTAPDLQLPPDPAPSRRLSRAQRRAQLLDTAAEVLLERGVAGVTMEGVAARAGVSKALPYTHFDNATDLVRALRDRELDDMRNRIHAGSDAAEGYEAKLAGAVHAYFDVIKERGTVLVAALRGLPMDDAEASERENPGFYAALFEQEAQLSPELAQVASSIFVAAGPGAAQSWARGTTRRATAEAALVRVIVAGVAALAEEQAAGRLPIARPH
jgi:AcrR family transcriptional regulator